MEYVPIKLGVFEEKQKPPPKKMLKVFESIRKFCKSKGTPYENQINEQLKIRKKFPCSEWEKFLRDTENIEKVLESIARDSERVNHNYIPSDLLIYVLWDDLIDDLPCYLLAYVKKYLKVECSIDTIISMATSGLTLGEFFTKILLRVN